MIDLSDLGKHFSKKLEWGGDSLVACVTADKFFGDLFDKRNKTDKN